MTRRPIRRNITFTLLLGRVALLTRVVAPFFSLWLYPYTSLRGSACAYFAGRSSSKELTPIVHCDRLADAYRLNQL